ncbi:hypothetical protein POM88_001459 [Heracleum sosnowskyi]|uniref:Uncharacterized protein n=1 Tax=Heracleum sosnowskyi TaxID=360622 RepID=A0AAD8N9N7_9APIA|nr:hypothetical protein POM88_001459 [Heracleum sosnowskyi]
MVGVFLGCCLCGTSICLRHVTAKGVYSAIANNGVTHLCAALVVLNTLVKAPQKEKVVPLPRLVHVMTASSALPSSVLHGILCGADLTDGFSHAPLCVELLLFAYFKG